MGLRIIATVLINNRHFMQKGGKDSRQRHLYANNQLFNSKRQMEACLVSVHRMVKNAFSMEEKLHLYGEEEEEDKVESLRV